MHYCFAGNDVFYKNINDFSLEIFEPTIRTRWDRHAKYLKDELTNRLVGLFEKDTFDTSKVLKKDGKHLNIVWDQYRVHLEKNPRYEHPPMIPSRDWKSLVEDGKERALRKEKDTTRNREVCNTFHSVTITLIIINFYIESGKYNLIQNLIRLLDT